VADRLDHKHLIDLLEAYLLEEEPSLTGNELADDVGISFETARARWRSLGFTAVGGDVPAFTHADLEALRMTQRLSDLGFVDADDEAALIRTLGRSFARLAEWQMRLLARMIDIDEMEVDELSTIMTEVVPTVEKLQNYVWRRHTLAVAARLLLAADEDDEEIDDADEDSDVIGVGFADIVNYTRQSRSLSQRELSSLVENFEARALEIVGGRDGRIIKTIGDEILFVADDAASIARIGLELVEERLRDEDFPELRVGLAWGSALARLGDVLGPVVNVASRLTSTARPGRVLVDRALSEALQEDEHFKLRRLRRTSVRGYRKLEPWSLRRPAEEEVGSSEDGTSTGSASSSLQQDAKGLVRGGDEVDPPAEGPVGGQDTD
jgi:adenylate cyclase